MKFYDTLQLDPQIIKGMMGRSSAKKEKIKLGTAMFLRSLRIKTRKSDLSKRSSWQEYRISNIHG